MKESAMLEFDDIQHILLTRAPALTGRYEFLSFRERCGRAGWLSGFWRRCIGGGCGLSR